MIASRPLQDVIRNVGRNALDLPVAALAALAVAFVAFAMPSDLLTELVGASGLPSLLPAAEPPLGFKARIGVGLAGARRHVRPGLRAASAARSHRARLVRGQRAPAESEPAAPRPRRRDFHPDAPAPRPISAARDFGEPAPPSPPPSGWPAAAEPEAAPADARAGARARRSRSRRCRRRSPSPCRPTRTSEPCRAHGAIWSAGLSSRQARPAPASLSSGRRRAAGLPRARRRAAAERDRQPPAPRGPPSPSARRRRSSRLARRFSGPFRRARREALAPSCSRTFRPALRSNTKRGSASASRPKRVGAIRSAADRARCAGAASLSSPNHCSSLCSIIERTFPTCLGKILAVYEPKWTMRPRRRWSG